MARTAERLDKATESEEATKLYRMVLTSLRKQGFKITGSGRRAHWGMQGYLEWLLLRMEGGKAELLQGYRDQEREAEEIHGRGS